MINSQKGFTLIEVIIAMAILAIGILSVAAMQMAAVRGNSNAVNLTEASINAGDIVEQIINKPYDDPWLEDNPSGGGLGTAGLNDTDTAGAPADGGPQTKDHYTVFWNVAENYPIDNTKTIRVIVRRNDMGVTKEVAVDYIKLGSI